MILLPVYDEYILCGLQTELSLFCWRSWNKFLFSFSFSFISPLSSFSFLTFMASCFIVSITVAHPPPPSSPPLDSWFIFMSSQTNAPARSVRDQLGRIDQQEPCFVANARQSTALHKLNVRQPGRITQGILHKTHSRGSSANWCEDDHIDDNNDFDAMTKRMTLLSPTKT